MKLRCLIETIFLGKKHKFLYDKDRQAINEAHNVAVT